MIPTYNKLKMDPYQNNCPACRMTTEHAARAMHTRVKEQHVAREVSRKTSAAYAAPCPHCTTPIHSAAPLAQKTMREKRITLLKAAATDAVVGTSCGTVVAVGLCITASLPAGVPTAVGYLAMAATAYMVAKKVEDMSRTQPAIKTSFFGAFGGMVATQYATLLGIIETATVTSLPGCAIIPVAACCGAITLGLLER